MVVFTWIFSEPASTGAAEIITHSYLVNQSPGVLLGDGSREHFEDLIKVETIIRV